MGEQREHEDGEQEQRCLAVRGEEDVSQVGVDLAGLGAWSLPRRDSDPRTESSRRVCDPDQADHSRMNGDLQSNYTTTRG